MIQEPRRLVALVSLLLSSATAISPGHAQGRGDYDSSKKFPIPQQAPTKAPLDMSKERQRWLFARACEASVSTWSGIGDWIVCTGFVGDGTPAGKGHIFLSDQALVSGLGKTIKSGNEAGAICELDITYTESAGVLPVLVCEFLRTDLPNQQVRVLADGAVVARFTPTAPIQTFELGPAFGSDRTRMAAVRELKVIFSSGGKDVTLLEARISDPSGHISAMIREVAEQDGLASLSSGNPAAGRGKKTCFLTSACCAEVGLADDCFELTALRRYRDRVLAVSPGGAAEIELYYALAPVLLRALRRERSKRALLRLYFTHILPCAVFATLGLHEATHRRYVDMMVRLCGRLAPAYLPLVQRVSSRA